MLKYIALALSLTSVAAINADCYEGHNNRDSYYSEDNRDARYNDGRQDDRYDRRQDARSDRRQDARDNRAEGVSDQDLEKNVRDQIGSGYFSKGYDQVNVQVRNGVVTLRGTVQTREDKDKVEKAVRDLDGVKNVNNQITVQQRNPNEAQR